MSEMERSQHPAASWYSDPTSGPGYRYWDGTQWSASPPTRRGRRRRWLILGAVAIVGLGVCVVAPAIYVRSQLGPSVEELSAAADELELTPSLTLVRENMSGNQLCLDECLILTRDYASGRPSEEVRLVIVNALQTTKYHCIPPSAPSVQRDWCGTFESGVLSYWQRATGLYVEYAVYPMTDTIASTFLHGVVINPAWTTYVVLSVRPGAP